MCTLASASGHTLQRARAAEASYSIDFLGDMTGPKRGFYYCYAGHSLVGNRWPSGHRRKGQSEVVMWSGSAAHAPDGCGFGGSVLVCARLSECVWCLDVCVSMCVHDALLRSATFDVVVWPRFETNISKTLWAGRRKRADSSRQAQAQP